MSEPDGLILNARIRMLQRSLAAVNEVLTSVEAKRQQMRDPLSEITNGAREKLGAIETSARAIRDMVQGLGGEYEDAVVEQTDKIGEQLVQLRSLIRKVNNSARKFEPLEKDTTTALSADFINVVEAQLTRVSGLLQVVAAADSPNELQQVWRQLPAVSAESEHFFAAYVELLAGLALRDTGFDEGIPELADALIRSRIDWISLTIPAHKPRNQPTTSHMLHLGFPEWTPWALPLAAYEWGRSELRGPALAGLITSKKAEGFREVDVENCLADMMATYLVGPAYVWARTLIQFDPAAVDYGRRCSEARSFEAMLAALRRMDDPATPSETPFGVLATRLGDAWAAAVTEVGSPAPSDDERALAGKEVPQAELEQWLDVLSSYRPRALKAADWVAVREGADRLRALLRDEPLDWTPDNQRIVLNAAWLVRTTDDLDRGGDITPLDRLAKAVVQILRGIVRPTTRLQGRSPVPLTIAAGKDT